ncbi:phosphatidate cytidylyltransferase [Amorphoplanes nipponensis]|uniref:Phosphatidate cytidylyltransferase n=1 Tax=Actinoplanes nipponensis TaxID=135950 RepID=A0A919MQN4_9ACTN|nr:phosphatidate cytidylyltransferase [Actinoplanes nipponensis]GIE53332.1 phosphatidate cytidylyltransferase [Actinoplanes nipponensis]
MSYLEPRGGQTPSGGRASGQPDVPAPYGPDAPAGEPDPYAAHRRQAAQRATESGPSWNAFTPGPAGEPAPQPGPPAWEAPVAATSTSQAEWELTAAEADGPRGPGRRRAGRGKPGAKPVGRAGRNLPAAIAVGVSMVLVVLASLFVWKEAFLGVIALATGIGIWEMARALRVTGARPPLIPLVAGGVLMTGLAWYGSTDALILGLLVTVLATLLWRLADGVAGITKDLAATALIAVYVPFLLSFGVLLAKPDDGDYRVLITLLAVVLSDTGGYAAGVFLGKHPMAPTISPKKSWEGFAGSVTAAAIGSSLLAYFLLDVPFYWGLLFGAVISVVAVVGDLAESMLKRDIGIKDMSNLLPGHGGLMDRLDSILFAVPTAFLLLSLIAPPG